MIVLSFPVGSSFQSLMGGLRTSVSKWMWRLINIFLIFLWRCLTTAIKILEICWNHLLIIACVQTPPPLKKIRQRDVCEAIHIYRMKTLPCIRDAHLALGAQDTPAEGKECVTYPCYPRPHKTPVVLISYPDLTLFYTWPWEIRDEITVVLASEQAHLCEFRGNFSRPILFVHWQLCRQYFPRTSESARRLLVCGLSQSPAVCFSRHSRFSQG